MTVTRGSVKFQQRNAQRWINQRENQPSMSDDVGQMIEMPGSTHHTTNHPTPVNVSAAAHAHRPFVLEKWDEWLCPSALCLCGASTVSIFGALFLIFTICARWRRPSVCVCFDASRMTSATTSTTALRSAFLFVSFQFPIFSEFAVSACASRPFLANAI